MRRLSALIACLVCVSFQGSKAVAGEKAKKLPNILWITCEDIGPHLGAYGDKYATTPNLDRLAARSLRYRVAWSNAPVCAPARTTIISGLYATSTGAHHMRSMTKLPESMQMFVAYLRALGYYCTNNVKEDYNLEKAGKVWDESSKKAHWKNRGAGQPFFAVFNDVITHESQIRTKPHKLVHDPAKVRLPAYHPDTPEVRHDWAQYYDNITVMDKRVGALLRELEEAGLADDTIVIYFSDHGSGMPRSKRWPYDSGLHVPFIVHVPANHRGLAPKDYQPGGLSDRLVSFVDLAPTMISLAGGKPPAFMQGSVFLGPNASPCEYLYGFRGRMDERIDLVRSVRDARYIYVRNYMPHKLQGQHLDYMWQTPTTRVWKQLFDAGKLKPPQTYFWEAPRPPEELYDLNEDPDEVKNLAAVPDCKGILERLRQVQREHLLKIRDVGFLPENEIHERSGKGAPYDMGHDNAKYPMARILDTADLASMMKPADLPKMRAALTDGDSAVRYWGALGILMRGKDAISTAKSDLHKALADPAPAVRIAAAEALGKYGDDQDAAKALPVLVELISLQKNGLYVSVQALNAMGEFGKRAASALPAIRTAGAGQVNVNARMNQLVPRLVEKLVADLK